MPLSLSVTAGPNRGRVFTFEQHDLFLVGRSPDVHFSLAEDPYLSRIHFMVEYNPPLCRVVDLGSRSGTLVNGQKLTGPRDLDDGDNIQAGQTQLRVVFSPADKRLAATLTPLPAVAAGGIPLARPVTVSSRSTVPAASNPTASSANFPSTLPAAAATGLPALPGYQALRKLGEGGMGVVYQMRRHADGLGVAVKTVRPAVLADETAVTRFLREAEILKQLRHPHIVSFLEMGRAGNPPLLFFAMEFVDGRNLGELRLDCPGPFPVGRAVRLVCQVLEALAYAHGQGFVHRDIKPGNVLVAGREPAEIVKLADFGLARTYQVSQLSGLTMTGAVGGTPSYMPPEQVLDFRTARPPADQYAAAATLYVLLTGQPLYPKASTFSDLLSQILAHSPTPIELLRSGLPAGLCQAVGKALGRRPEDRFADVGQFRQALAPFTTL